MSEATMRLDHLVLEVRDADRAAAFYQEVLGLAPVRLDAYRAGEVKFPSVRVDDATIIDLFPPPLWRGSSAQNPNHLCLTTTEAGFHAIEARLAERGVAVTRRADHNFGARGFGRSLYFDDRDGVAIEVRWYPTHIEPGAGR